MKKTNVLVLGICVLSLFVCLFSGSLEAATINVPADYATISAAITAASDGDIIQVAAGTYSYTSKTTVNKQLRIQGAGASNTTISISDCSIGIEITSNSVRIKDFTLLMAHKDTNDAVINITSNVSNLTISDNVIRGSTGSVENGIACGSGITMTNSTISNNTLFDLTKVGMSLGIQNSTVNSNTITGSSATDNGIDIRGEGSNTIFNNIISNFNAATKSGIRVFSGNSNIIYDNKVSNCRSGVNVNSNYNFISNNLIYGFTGAGINFGTSGGNISGNIAVNNTVYSTTSGTGNGLNLNAGSKTISNTTLLNNISVNCDQGIGLSSSGITGTTANYNCIYGNTTNYQNTTAGANDVNSDPLFVGGGDYSLQSTSPCIDAGTSTYAPSTDIIGTARPQGNGYDIGCYEYISPASAEEEEEEEEAVSTTIDITGNAVDAETGESLTDAEIKIYNENGTLADSAITASAYTLTVDKNNSYYIRVEKELYTFPSTKKAKVVDGDHGEVFSAGTSNITMNLYMDEGYPLEITKTANKKKAVIGDIITYDISIHNKSTLEQTNVNIVDEITNGFKYVTGSSYVDSTKISDPTINSPAAFSIGTVDGSETVHLSYQVRVSTGIVPGEYKTTAIAKHATKNWDLSNKTTYNVEIVQDALFDKGTIIGKMFNDLNGNSVQEKPEAGIPGVRIATEYGVVVTTDRDGKFHIPNVPEGTHLLKVDINTLPEGAKITTDNPYVVKMTKGLLAKVSFGLMAKELTVNSLQLTEKELDTIKYLTVKVTEEAGKVKIGILTEKPDMPVKLAIDDKIEEDVTTDKNGLYSYEIVLPGGEHKITAATEIAKGEVITETKTITTRDSYFFLVALGEGILKNLRTSGNIEMATSGDSDWFEKGLRLTGKGAFYLRAKVKGKYLITASADTERSKREELFTNLDPDKYYPIYGDASDIDYSANDTQDEGYLLVEWDRSYGKWGAFQTEFNDTDLAVYRRTLQGGNIVYESVKRTKFSDPWTKIKAFYAKAMQLGAHDEFIGTGGSLYYLRHDDVIEGSEKIKVELRDKSSNIIINEYELQEQTDYQIDYDQGRIILTKPLGSTSYAYNTSIISNDIMGGPRVYLIADYEYRPQESMRKQAYGVKASQQIGQYVRVGGSYIDEEKEAHHYQLKSVDSTVKLNKQTDITGEYAQSRQTQMGGGYSTDGGLTFNDISDTISDDHKGDAWEIKGKTTIFNKVDVQAYYLDKEKYFSSASSLTDDAVRKYGASITARLVEGLILGVKHGTQELLDTTRVITPDLIGGVKKSNITTALLDYIKGRWDSRLEYQHQSINDRLADFDYLSIRQLNDNDFIAGRIGYKLTDRLHPYIGGQGTLSGPSNNQGFIGADIQILKDTYINIKETVGNLGNSTLLGITSQLTEGTHTYSNIEVGNDANAGRFTKTTWGQVTQMDRDTKVYAEQDYSSYQENILQGNIIGYDKKITDNLALGLNYERSSIEKELTAVNRDAGGITLNYLNIDTLELFSKLEIRNDRDDSPESASTNGAGTTRQWLTQNRAIWYLTKDISLLGRFNWSRSRDVYSTTNESTKARFHEAGAGLAYRPINFDRLNILAKYSYITDLGPEYRDIINQTTDNRKNIYSIEGAFDLCKYIQLVGKYALRDMDEKAGPRDWTSSDTHLWIARTNFHIIQNQPDKPFFLKGWDLAAEYRVLRNPDSDDERKGWLVELDKDICQYARLGVGYNFTDYDDDLSNDDNYDAKGFFVRVNGKY